MPLAVGNGGPSSEEIERLRLILSTYQDGTGMLVTGPRRSLPGWRDFERSVALTFDGRAVESKEIFDVLIPFDDPEYGISCKMRSTLKDTARTGRVTMELSNSSAKFATAFETAGIPAAEYRDRPAELGKIILATVSSWHHAVADTIDLERSSFLALSYNDVSGQYQLHQFSHDLPDARSLTWSFPDARGKGGILRPGKRLRAALGDATVLEFYYGSGGQLKYYPHVNEPFGRLTFSISKVSMVCPTFMMLRRRQLHIFRTNGRRHSTSRNLWMETLQST